MKSEENSKFNFKYFLKAFAIHFVWMGLSPVLGIPFVLLTHGFSRGIYLLKNTLMIGPYFITKLQAFIGFMIPLSYFFVYKMWEENP